MKLLEIAKKINKFSSEVNKVFGTDETQLEYILQDIQDLFYDEIGIPKDNSTNYSVEEQQKFGETGEYPKEFFCRDWHDEIFGDFLDDKITEQEMLKKFKEVENEYKENKVQTLI